MAWHIVIGKFTTLENDVRGTSFMVNNVQDKIFPKLSFIHKYNLVLIPGENNIEDARKNKNIVWCHIPEYLMPDDCSIFLADIDIVNNTVGYVVQSDFHKKNLIEAFSLDPQKVFVANNAFNSLPKSKKNKNKMVNFFYAGQAERGLDMLLECIGLIKDKNISLTIHGCECPDCVPKVVSDQRINFVGFTDKETYINNVLNSHILSYPCTFQETACIMAMECLSGGLKIIASDLGALPETTNGYATMMKNFPYKNEDIEKNRKKIIKFFTKEMKKSIKEIRKGKFDPTDQINYINNRFTWENTEKQWIKLDKYLQSLKDPDII
jgi:glycosyltransferase involved in cell wall biosynthesis